MKKASKLEASLESLSIIISILHRKPSLKTLTLSIVNQVFPTHPFVA